jgi:putative restriction endonuclease
MAATYVFGEIAGHPESTTYINRTDAKDAGVHQVTQQGISGNRTIGANSIVVNGGYEDDLDVGDEIIYTGAGGNDPTTQKQIADQTFEQLGNAALVVSEENGLPVRVIRGNRGDPAHSPKAGLRYDGLYRVESHWYETGKSGFRVCRYRLLKLTATEAAPYLASAAATPGGTGIPSSGSASTGGVSGSPAGPSSGRKGPGAPPTGTKNPDRGAGVTVRVVRDTAVSNWVKSLYAYACQVCDDVLDVPVGNYAEGAHIRPLGKPHNGPDTVDNMLCLCPTHHVLFDKGAIYISDDFMVRNHHGSDLGSLTRKAMHPIDVKHVQYHRAASGY